MQLCLIFGLSYDFLIACMVVFLYQKAESYGDSFSWATAIIITIILATDNFLYYYVYNSKQKGRQILPTKSFATAERDNTGIADEDKNKKEIGSNFI